jgi:hypothetical protein
MTLPEIRRQLTDTKRQIVELEAWHNTLTTVRQNYLLDATETGREVLAIVDRGIRSDFQGVPSEVAHLGFTPGRPGLHATIAKLATLREQQTLLEKQLPSAQEIATLEQRAAQLVSEISHAEGRCSEAWQRFVVALEAAETSGREWVATRSGLQTTAAELKHLVTEFGLSVLVPAIFTPDARDANYVELLGNWMRVAAFGTLDTSVERDLAVARERRSAVLTG